MSNEKQTMKLETLSNHFDIPLWTLRKWASQRRFPGLIKKGRSVYVEVEKFRVWFLSSEVEAKVDRENTVQFKGKKSETSSFCILRGN